MSERADEANHEQDDNEIAIPAKTPCNDEEIGYEVQLMDIPTLERGETLTESLAEPQEDIDRPLTYVTTPKKVTFTLHTSI